MKRQSALRRRSSQAAARSRSFRRGRGFEQLEERHLLAAITWDGGAGTLNWSDASNWDTDTVPTSADDVSIGDLAGPVLIGGTTSAASIISAESLTFSGGTLTTTATVDVTGTADMLTQQRTLSDGTWTVAGTFTANNSTNNRLDSVTVNGDLTLARYKLLCSDLRHDDVRHDPDGGQWQCREGQLWSRRYDFGRHCQQRFEPENWRGRQWYPHHR